MHSMPFYNPPPFLLNFFLLRNIWGHQVQVVPQWPNPYTHYTGIWFAFSQENFMVCLQWWRDLLLEPMMFPWELQHNSCGHSLPPLTLLHHASKEGVHPNCTNLMKCLPSSLRQRLLRLEDGEDSFSWSEYNAPYDLRSIYAHI